MPLARRVVVAALIAAASLSAPASSAAAPHLAVVGFQEESDPLARLDDSAGALTTVGVDGINLTRSGGSTTTVSAAASAQRDRAHALGLRAELLVGNFSGDDFSEPIAYRLLSNSDHRQAVAMRLAAIVRRDGWDGISVDLESLLDRDRSGLTAFLRALRAQLPVAGIAVDVQANASDGGYLANGYDLDAIGAVVDQVELMTYDQHGPWSHAGPIGAVGWQRRAVRVLLRHVPGKQVDLGVAGYGYGWRPNRAVALSDAAARRLAGTAARWDEHVGEWTAALPDGSVLWWSDARSYAVRAELATALHLHGLAVWSLGLSDPIG